MPNSTAPKFEVINSYFNSKLEKLFYLNDIIYDEYDMKINMNVTRLLIHNF